MEVFENDLGQLRHLKGVSPVSVRICVVRLTDWENDMGQLDT